MARKTTYRYTDIDGTTVRIIVDRDEFAANRNEQYRGRIFRHDAPDGIGRLVREERQPRKSDVIFEIDFYVRRHFLTLESTLHEKV